MVYDAEGNLDERFFHLEIQKDPSGSNAVQPHYQASPELKSIRLFFVPHI